MSATQDGLRGALRDRTTLRLLGAHGLQGVGQTLGTIATSVALFDLTASAGWVAAGASAWLLPYVLLSALAGAVAGRLPTRRVLVAANLVRLAACLALAAAVVVGASPWVIVALAFASAAAGTPCYPAIAAVMPREVPRRHLAAANALLSTVETGAFVIGPALGGLVLTFAPPTAAFLANGLVFVAALAVLPPLTRGAVRDAGERLGLVGELRDAVAVVRRAPDAAVQLLLVVAVNLAHGLAMVLLLPVALDRLGSGNAGFGLLNSAVGTGAFVGLLVAGRLAMRRRALALLAGSVLATGVPFALLGVVGDLAVAAALMATAGLGGVLTEVLALTLLQRALPARTVAAVAGMFDALVVGAVLVGAAIAPLLLNVLGLGTALAVAGAVVPGLALLLAGRLVLLGRRAAARAAEPLAEHLAALPLLAGAPRSAVEALACSATVERVAPRTAVVVAGAEPDDFFVLCEGRAEVLAADTDAPLAVLGPGAGFGEIGLLRGVPRTATVVTTEPALVARIRGEAFLASVHGAPLAAATSPGGGLVGRLAAAVPAVPDDPPRA